MKKYALAAIFAACPAIAEAATLSVGAGKTYTTLSAASAKANPGDTIVVYPGVYTSGAYWYDSNLTIRAATGSKPGSVIVRDGEVGGKGLFVTKGANITIQGLRFENARVSAGNGAGIRAEGSNLTVLDSQFYNNEMGILANALSGSTLTVKGSSFDLTRSRRSGSLGHSIYAGSIGSLVVEESTFKRGTRGHYIKSRAKAATITGNTIDDTYGSASYLIELAEGGPATISGNVLTKGANAANCCTAIAYGFEMKKGGSYVNAPGPVDVSSNRFTNLRASTVTFFSNRSAPANPATLTDNTMIATKGTIRLSYGPVTVGDAQRVGALSFGDSEIVALDSGYDMARMASGFRLADASDNVFAASAVSAASEFSVFADEALRVPTSGSFALLGFGIAALASYRRRKR